VASRNLPYRVLNLSLELVCVLLRALTAVVRSEAALYVKLRMQELMNGVGVSGILY